MDVSAFSAGIGITAMGATPALAAAGTPEEAVFAVIVQAPASEPPGLNMPHLLMPATPLTQPRTALAAPVAALPAPRPAAIVPAATIMPVDTEAAPTLAVPDKVGGARPAEPTLPTSTLLPPAPAPKASKIGQPVVPKMTVDEVNAQSAPLDTSAPAQPVPDARPDVVAQTASTEFREASKEEPAPEGAGEPVLLAGLAPARPIPEPQQPARLQIKPATPALEVYDAAGGRADAAHAQTAETSPPPETGHPADIIARAPAIEAPAPKRPQPQGDAAPTSIAPVQPAPQASPAPAQTVSSHAARIEEPRARLDGGFADEIGLSIARRVKAGTPELTVRLDPAELGKIEIRLALDDRGQLRAVLAAESPAVLDALRRDQGEITRALVQAGVSVDGESLRFTNDASGGGQRQDHAQRHREPASARFWADADGDARAAMPDTPQRRVGRVDLIA